MKPSAEAVNRMVAECRRRGYDPDMMLGLARALPDIQFRRSGGYLHPVWRGKRTGRSRAWKPDDEVK